MRFRNFILGTCLVFLCQVNLALAGFGITPPYVRSDTLRPGSHYTQEIIVVRGDPIEDLNAEITLNMPQGIADWFSVDRGMKFVLPKGETQVKMIIGVDVPPEASLGSYAGNIRIRTESLDNPSSGVSIALGAQIDVNLKVVDKIESFEVKRVELSEAEQGFKKLWLDFPGKIDLMMQIENTGNVESAPSKIHFDIYSKDGVTKLESVENTNKIELIPAFLTKNVVAHVPTWLAPGGYTVRYEIFRTNEVTSTGELPLSVLPKGTIPGYQAYGWEGLSFGDKLSVILPSVLLGLVLIGALLTKRGRRTRKRKKKVVRQDGGDPSTSDGVESIPTPVSHVVNLSRPKEW